MHRLHILVGKHHKNSKLLTRCNAFFVVVQLAFYPIISLLFSHYQICLVFHAVMWIFVECHPLNSMQKVIAKRKLYIKLGWFPECCYASVKGFSSCCQSVAIWLLGCFGWLHTNPGQKTPIPLLKCPAIRRLADLKWFLWHHSQAKLFFFSNLDNVQMVGQPLSQRDPNPS